MKDISMKDIPVRVAFFAWQLPQLLLGVLVLLWHKLFMRVRYLKAGRVSCGGSVAVFSAYCSKKKNSISAFSLGRRIFIYYNDSYPDKKRIQEKFDETIRHEFGHTLQSRKLGWLYLVVIGLVSLIVTGLGGSWSDKCYTEKWANRLTENLYIEVINI